MSDILARGSSHYRHLLIDRVPSMLAYWDVDLRCRFANRAGQRHVEEWALRRKDGSVVPVEVRARFLPDGRRVGYRCFGR
jgi:hypothetical protein